MVCMFYKVTEMHTIAIVMECIFLTFQLTLQLNYVSSILYFHFIRHNTKSFGIVTQVIIVYLNVTTAFH